MKDQKRGAYSIAIDEIFRKKEEFKEIYNKLFNDFISINKEIADLFKQEQYGEKNWYPKIVDKVRKWNESARDEFLGRDLLRKDIRDAINLNNTSRTPEVIRRLEGVDKLMAHITLLSQQVQNEAPE